MLLKLGPFGGMAPSIDHTLLDDHQAQFAKNILFGYRDLRPLKNPHQVATVGGGAKSLMYGYGGWTSSTGYAHIVPTVVQDDAFNRLYATDSAIPYPVYSVRNGASLTVYRLGVPAPTVKPSVKVVGEATTEDATLADTRSYVYTYVTAYGEEGPPSPPSDQVSVLPGQSVEISGMQGTMWAGNFALKGLYRTNTGSNSTEFQLVATPIPYANTTAKDEMSADELGEVLQSMEWDPPPSDLLGLMSTPAGFLVGFSNKTVCFSEPWRPHAWPVSYRLPLEYTIVALASFGNSILVMTEGPPYIITGVAPSALSPEKLEIGYGCISRYGVVDMGYAVIYPAVNGLMLASMGKVELLTEKLLTREEWQGLGAASIRAGMWDNKYVAFWGNGYSKGFIFDPRTGDFCLHDIEGDAVYTRQDNGLMYFVKGASVYQWDYTAADPCTLTWRSKIFTLPYNQSVGVVQVRAKGYPVPLDINMIMDDQSVQKIVAERGSQGFGRLSEGVLVYSVDVQDNLPFRLPGGFRFEQFSIEVSGTNAIQSIMLASSMSELAEVGV